LRFARETTGRRVEGWSRDKMDMMDIAPVFSRNMITEKNHL